jgi:hypothetical protein
LDLKVLIQDNRMYHRVDVYHKPKVANSMGRLVALGTVAQASQPVRGPQSAREIAA